MCVYAFYKHFFAPETRPKGLNQREYQKYKLTKITEINHNTKIFRFALQTPTTILGLPTGNHISFRYFDNNNDEIRRPYTPITSNDDKGYFDMLIKIYEHGKMTQHLNSLKLGNFIQARGPMGKIEYDAPGHFIVKKGKETLPFNVSNVNLICGGTGITPMLQLIRQIIKDDNDDTKVKMIFGNVSKNDILLYDELKDLRSKNANIKIRFTIDKKDANDNTWNESVGYVTNDMINEFLFKPNDKPATFLCGPPVMVKILEKTLKNMGYPDDKILKF